MNKVKDIAQLTLMILFVVMGSLICAPVWLFEKYILRKKEEGLFEAPLFEVDVEDIDLKELTELQLSVLMDPGLDAFFMTCEEWEERRKFNEELRAKWEAAQSSKKESAS
jgi:hypothetical protein